MAEEKADEEAIGRELTNKTPFVPVYHDFLDSEKLCGEEQAVYIQISRYVNKKLDCAWPSISRLCKKLDWGKDKVQKYINLLVQKGFIEKRNNIHNTKQNNQYFLKDTVIATGKESYRPYDEESAVNEKLYVYYRSDDDAEPARIRCYSKRTKVRLAIFIENYLPLLKEKMLANGLVNEESVNALLDAIRENLFIAASSNVVPVNRGKVATEEFFEAIALTNYNSLLTTCNKLLHKFERGEVENAPPYILSSLFNSRLEPA